MCLYLLLRLCPERRTLLPKGHLLIDTVKTSYTRSCDTEMPWTLEAGFALATLVVTLMLSGLGLFLKYRKGFPLLGKNTLLPMFAEGMFTMLANILNV